MTTETITRTIFKSLNTHTKMVVLAGYLIWHCKDGLISDKDNAMHQTTEVLPMPQLFIKTDEMKSLFASGMDEKFGIGKWKFEYFLGLKRVDNGFFIEKTNIANSKGDLYLKGFGKFDQYCHTLEGVKALLGNDHFINSNSDIVPLYQAAQQLMEERQHGYLITFYKIESYKK